MLVLELDGSGDASGPGSFLPVELGPNLGLSNRASFEFDDYNPPNPVKTQQVQSVFHGPLNSITDLSPPASGAAGRRSPPLHATLRRRRAVMSRACYLYCPELLHRRPRTHLLGTCRGHSSAACESRVLHLYFISNFLGRVVDFERDLLVSAETGATAALVITTAVKGHVGAAGHGHHHCRRGHRHAHLRLGGLSACFYLPARNSANH